MNKFNPHYELKLTYPSNGTTKEAIITDPISIRFSVTKNTFATTNVTKIVVYNMDIETRTGIYQDNLLFTTESAKTATLSAGYGDSLTLISFGYIQQCYTTRQGVDIVTEITVIDPDILTQYTAKTFKAGTEKKEAYLNMIREGLPNVQVGEGINNISGKFEVDTVFNGNTFIVVNSLTGGHTFVDDKYIHTLMDTQTISNYGVYYIASETGLLGTPIRQDARLEIKMLFEPTIKIGQLVEIKSETYKDEFRFDGQYKVIGLNHECSISNSEGGTRITTLSLLYTEYLERAAAALTGVTNKPYVTKFENNREIPVFATIGSDDYDVYNYIKNNGGNVPPNKFIVGKISWQNVIYPSGTGNTKADVQKEITPQDIANCRKIVEMLYYFCSGYSGLRGKTIKINSAYRTRQNNSRLEGSASNSLHLSGSAIDFKLENAQFNQYAKIFINNWKFGLGVYYQDGFIHVDHRKNYRFK